MIRYMQEFVKIDTANVLSLLPYTAASPDPVCDNTVGSIYQWRDIFNIHCCIAGGRMVIRSQYPGIGDCYSVPLGEGDSVACFHAIEEDAAKLNIAVRFGCVGEKQLQELIAHYGEARLHVEIRRAWADYLYAPEGFAYRGKRFHTQKNHVNRFHAACPNALFREVREEDMPAIATFLSGLQKHKGESLLEQTEIRGTLELIEQREALKQIAACLWDGERLVALSVGEIRGNVLYVHGEKADKTVPGSFPAMAQAFVEHAAAGIDTVNREDDGDDAGIRYSKEQYRPVALLEKRLVSVS